MNENDDMGHNNGKVTNTVEEEEEDVSIASNKLLRRDEGDDGTEEEELDKDSLLRVKPKDQESEDKFKERRHSSEIGVIGRSRMSSSSSEDNSEEEDGKDPYKLQRFVNCQERDFHRALREIKAGSKRSCWMWYAFF